MDQITIISGKGGTGKTTISAAFAVLSEDSVFADTDVDAPDLHILLNPTIKHQEVFLGLSKAVIEQSKCRKCGKCYELCRFDAITVDNFSRYDIATNMCEGCNVCVEFCPYDAIYTEKPNSGIWYISDTKYGPMVHAYLTPGEENSGMLVSLVRREAFKLAKEKGYKRIIIDGPPGSSCAVISALTGVNKAVLVTEPSASGFSDLKKVVSLFDQFSLKGYVIINKYDINPLVSDEIIGFAEENNLEVLGKIAYDKSFIDALRAKKTFVNYFEEKHINSVILNDIKMMYKRLISDININE